MGEQKASFFSARYAIFVTILAMGLLGESPQAQALTPAEIQNAQRAGDRILREQQIQQQQDMERNLNTRRPHTTIDVPKPAVQKGHGEGCRKIAEVVLLDPAHMSVKEKDKMLTPYAGKCLGVDEIQKLMSDVTAFYVDKGFVTTRVYLPPQDLTTGTLKLQIVPGKVSEIRTDAKKSQIRYFGNLFPGVVGEDLNLRDFEQGIDQINRLTSNSATIDIQPGEEPGESIVVINNNETTHWHLNTSLDNYGSKTTGRDQAGVTASFDNIAGLQDFTSLSVRKTLPLNEYLHQASSQSILISLPFGYSTVTVNYSHSDYDSSIISGANVLHLNGTGDNASLAFDHVVYRDQTSKASLNASLTNDVTDTFIENQLITVSSRTLTYATIGGNYSRQVKGGSATASVAYSRGLRALQALADAPGIANSVPHAQFDKFMLTAGYVRPFSAVGRNFSFSTQFSGQYAPKALYGSQQFSIGGLYSVRGFRDEGLANDNGYYVRNDLTLLETYSSNGHTVSFRPFIALDVGSVGSTHPGTPHGTLVGGAIGADLSLRALSFNILTGKSLVRPAAVEDSGFNTMLRLSVTF